MSNQVYDQFDEVFSSIMEFLNNYSSSDVLQDYFFQMFESFVYANVINNFFLNLTAQNLKNCGLSGDHIAKINCKYKEIRKYVKSTIEKAPFGRWKVDPAYYDDFKFKVKQDFPEAFGLISRIEKEIDIEELQRYLDNKAEKIKKAGKSGADFHSLLITSTFEAFVKLRGYFPYRNLDKIFQAIQKALPDISGTIAESIKENIDQPLKERRQRFHGLEVRRYARWQEPLDLFEALIGISEEVGEKHKKKLDESILSTNKAKFAALVRIHVRACRTANEILTLLKAGYPDGAFARWRTLYELAVIAFFLLANDDTVSERYLEHNTVLKYKQAREYQEAHLKLKYPSIDENELDDLKKEQDRLCKKYNDGFKNDWEWIPSKLLPNQNFRALAEKVSLEHLQPFFRWSSAAVHGLSRGFYSLGLTADSQDKILLCGPSNYGLADPLQNAALSLHQVTVCLLNLKPDFESLMEAYVMDAFVNDIMIKAVDVQKTIEKEEASKSN
jgi:hypothetical protein